MEYVNIVPRQEITARIRTGFSDWPVTIVFGPRQVGKTTLTKGFASTREHYFDLHQPIDRTRLLESNFRVLDGLDGVVVIDEAQEIPELYQKLRALADRRDRQTRFILTGSTSPKIFNSTSESLAGRARLLNLSGFSLAEVGPENWERLWVRGGFPEAYRKELDETSMEVRQHYISQVVGRDLPALAEIKLTTDQLHRFFRLLASHHGQYWSHSEIGGVMGINTRTVQRYVELFKGIYLVRELPPYFNNLGKRLRQMPKLYVRDTGLLHALLSIRDRAALNTHTIVGASWEGFGIEQLVALFHLRDEQLYTWSLQSGSEVDLVLDLPGGLVGVEFKAGDAPGRTRSMTAAIKALKLRKLYVIYPGDKDYVIDGIIEVVGIMNLPKRLSLIVPP